MVVSDCAEDVPWEEIEGMAMLEVDVEVVANVAVEDWTTTKEVAAALLDDSDGDATDPEKAVCGLFADLDAVFVGITDSWVGTMAFEVGAPEFAPPAGTVETSTFGQSFSTAVLLKNMPMRVSGNAVVPLHSLLIRLVTPSRKATHFGEQAELS